MAQGTAQGSNSVTFFDRTEAGLQLAEKIAEMGLEQPLVFAVEKGGLPLAREISGRLRAPLDMAPGFDHHEATEFSFVTADADQKSRSTYFASKSELSGHTLLIIDDVITNGAPALASIQHLSKISPESRIVVAAAVMSEDARARLMAAGAEIESLHLLGSVDASGGYFENETHVSDKEIMSVKLAAKAGRIETGRMSQWVEFPLGETSQSAKWQSEGPIRGVVVILNTDIDEQDSHSAAESVCQKVTRAGIGSLMLTLNRDDGDVAVLAHRIRQVANWLEEFSPAANLPLCYFGIGLGGAAMLEAAAAIPERIKTVVCYEAPLSLVEDFCPRVHAPTLLIVRDEHSALIEENRAALLEIMVESSLVSMSEVEESIGSVVENWVNRYFGARSAQTSPSSHATSSELGRI